MSGKLVRDKIPHIIQQKGQQATFRTLDNTEYVKELLNKLQEEINEFRDEPCLEEMADILEVLETVQNYYNFDLVELSKIKEKKKQERGGFADKVFLEL